jgi:alanyl-tRNA synthetase
LLNFKKEKKGYSLKKCHAIIKGIRFNKSFVNEISVDQECGLLLDQTNFYSEQGGQIYDEGYITKNSNTNDTDDQLEFIVKNVQVRGGYILHVGLVSGDNKNEKFKVGDTVYLHVDMNRRDCIMNNHTGTHVLNFALRQVMGDCDQRGSLVASDRLRFDFTSKTGAMKIEEVKRTEQIFQSVVDSKLDVFAQEVPLAVAKTIQGLRAVFDETYPDPVRVVSVGKSITDLIADPNGKGAFENSVEFCGGTHLKNSSHINKFIILSEEAIAKGVRRIIAITGQEGLRAHKKADNLEDEVKRLIKTIENQLQQDKASINLQTVNKNIFQLTEEINQSQISYWRKDAFRHSLDDLKKKLSELEKANKAMLLTKAIEECKEFIKDNQTATKVIKEYNVGGEAKSLNEVMKIYKTTLPNASVMLFSIDHINGKILCLSSVPDVNLILFND